MSSMDMSHAGTKPNSILETIAAGRNLFIN